MISVSAARIVVNHTLIVSSCNHGRIGWHWSGSYGFDVPDLPGLWISLPPIDDASTILSFTVPTKALLRAL